MSLNRIHVKHILKEYVNSKNIINEQQLNEIILNEDLRHNIILGIALLTSVFKLSDTQAQTAKKVLSNDEIKSKIEYVLTDTSALNKITKNLSPEVRSEIELNAKKALNILNTEYGRVSLTAKVGEKGLPTKLKQGYAITDIDTKTDTIKGKTEVIVYSDTIDIGFHSDNLFITGGYELSQDGINAIQSIKDSIKIVGGTITGVNIESSTDKEPIKMGNDKLSKLRADNVAKMFNGVGDITINTLPDQGPDLYHHPMGKSERLHDRDVTAKYRYVKVTIIASFQDTVKNENPDVIIEKNTITLVKAITNIGTIKKTNGNVKNKSGSHIIKRKKTVTCGVDGCPKFNGKKLLQWVSRGTGH